MCVCIVYVYTFRTYVAVQLTVLGAGRVGRVVVEAGALGVLRRRISLVAAALAVGSLLAPGTPVAPASLCAPTWWR